MAEDRIDFISAYCDGWCERCAFTERCSAYACRVAIGMCGDIEEAFELAVGRPQPVEPIEPDDEPTIGEQLMEELANHPPTEAELEAVRREEDARHERIANEPVTGIVETYQGIAAAWLADHTEHAAQHANSDVRDALAIVQWDLLLIGAKLHRALDGRDRRRTDPEDADDWDDDPIQTDWNGSAKVALLSIARSQDAWRTLQHAVPGGTTGVVADTLARLRTAADREFPDAMRFKRPGFDETGG